MSGMKEDDVRRRVLGFVAGLPEVAVVEHGEHLTFEVRGKRLGWYLVNHHGDGRLALSCRAAAGENLAAIARLPEVFHMPKYVGKNGWIGLWLDVDTLDWGEVETALGEAYLMTAPKKLAAEYRARILNEFDEL